MHGQPRRERTGRDLHAFGPAEFIAVDLSKLEKGASLHLKDIKAAQGRGGQGPWRPEQQPVLVSVVPPVVVVETLLTPLLQPMPRARARARSNSSVHDPDHFTRSTRFCGSDHETTPLCGPFR